jgi:hypothetical protein
MENPSLSIDREKLRMGKYTRRFADYTPDELEGLLWLLGEWTVRGDNGHRRSIAARKALLSRDRFTLEKAHEVIRNAREEEPLP